MAIINIAGVSLGIAGGVAQLHAPTDPSMTAYAAPFILVGSDVRIWNLACDITFERIAGTSPQGNYLYQVVTTTPNTNQNVHAGSVKAGRDFFGGENINTIYIDFNENTPAAFQPSESGTEQWTWDGYQVITSDTPPPHWWKDDRNVVGPLSDGGHYFTGHYTTPQSLVEPTSGSVGAAVTIGTDYRIKIWGYRKKP